MTTTRSEDAQPGDLAVHVDGDVVRLMRRQVPNDPLRSELDSDPFHPGWWVTDEQGFDGGGLADFVVDEGDWTIVTLDQVRAMAAAIRAGVPG